MDILHLAQAQAEYTTELRRHFHEFPEAGPAEQVGTLKTIASELDAMGIRSVRVPGGGLIGFIDGPVYGKTVLLRADTDALPIQEDPCNLKGPRVCVSKVPGVMHACGHDGHIAMLLTEAKILKSLEKQLKGSVILMFEEGEEGFKNVEKLCGYIQDAGLSIDTCYSTHVCWDIPAGKIACSEGAALSGLYWFDLSIHGQSGHGSRPDLCHSPVDCFTAIYESMQSLRLKTVDPRSCLTWSIGQIHAGKSNNVVPEELMAGGTIRFFDISNGRRFWNEFGRTVEELGKLYRCGTELSCRQNLEPTINDPACRRLFLNAVEKNLGSGVLIDWGPWMASESFSYMTSMYPGINTFTGIQNEMLGSGANHHTPQFDIDEAALPQGVAAALAYTLNFLENPPDTSGFQPLCGSLKELVDMLHQE
jgi:amidohydrolase